MTEPTRSAAIRAALGHPVIDGDGHIIEMIPVFADFIRDHRRGDIVEDAVIFNMERRSAERERAIPMAERRSSGLVPATWTIPTDAEYFATVTTPARYHERLGEAGIDFAVLCPTFGLPLLQIDDPDHRVTVCRLFNEYLAGEYRPYSDRFTVAAAVPMHNPEEAVAGLEHAKSLGAKVALVPSWVRRPRQGEGFAARPPRTRPALGVRPPGLARTPSVWTVHTTTTRYGPRRSSSGCHWPCTPLAWASMTASRRRTSPSTASGTSPRLASVLPSHSFSEV